MNYSPGISDDVLFSGTSFQNLVKMASSHYTSDLDAFYELIKNIEDQGAKEIITEFDYDNKRIILSGDGKGADVLELVRIQKSAGISSKDMGHHGIGLYCFLKFASRLIFISKKNEEYSIMSMSPHPNGNHIYSDVGAPHSLSGKEKANYHMYLSATRKFEEGTIYILEGVGISDIHKTNIASTFDMKETFSKRSYTNFLREKCNYSLKSMRFFIRDNHKKKLEHVIAKTGHGTSFFFSVPSSKCPYPKEKTVFCHQGREFELTLSCELWIGLLNKKNVVITEDHKNALSVDVAYGVSQKINRATSIFRVNPLGQYMEGEISFKVFARDNGGIPSFYSGARSTLLLNNSFGDTLSNMINRIEIDIMRPALEEFSYAQKNKMDTRINKRYDDLICGFFRSYNFDSMLPTSDGPITKQKRTCPSCNRELELLIAVPPSNSIKINAIFFQSPTYTCGACGHSWEKEQREPYTKHARNPLYAPPTPKEVSERKKKHGLGYNVHLRPLSSDLRRAMFESPSTVVINTSHSDYDCMTKSRVRTKDIVITLRNMNLAFREIVEHTLPNNPEQHLEILEDMCCKFHMWYLTEVDDLRKFGSKKKEGK
jgi:hypothetical protein